MSKRYFATGERCCRSAGSCRGRWPQPPKPAGRAGEGGSGNRRPEPGRNPIAPPGSPGGRPPTPIPVGPRRFPRGYPRLYGLESTVYPRGSRPIPLGQISIPRTHCQPVWFPHRRFNANVDWEIQVSYHLPNDAGLLSVLLTKECGVRLHDEEQFRHNRADTAEMAGPSRAA